MSNASKPSVPTWFWVIALIALLWNVMGCVAFFSEMFAQDAMMQSMTEEQKAWVRSTPRWIYVVFAISVATGVAGSVCLLIRNGLAVPLFVVSSFLAVIQMVYAMLIAGGLRVMGPSAAVMPSLVVIFSILWILFSVFAKRKGWFGSTGTQSPE